LSINKSYLRTSEFPSIWCPGCGHGIITQAAIRAIEQLGWDKDEVYAVSGIGCSARTPAYMDFNAVQTTHGRAITFATGMKMFRPEKKVILFLGDGDCASIGGNHLLHAARRNIDLTVIVMNNYIYGMTGGQCSPTTPHESRTSTTVFGNIDRELDICAVAIAAGATFVARSTAYHAAQLPRLINQGIANKGFSLIEVISPCPTGFGANNGYKAPADMYDMLRDVSISVDKAQSMSKAELKGKIVTGILMNEPDEEYIDKYDAMVAKILKNGNNSEMQVIEVGPETGKNIPIDRYEFCLSGFGGQGLILAGIILSEAMIRQNKNAVHNQSYGPQARGGASRSDVIISDREINYPEVTHPDFLLAMTQDSFNKFSCSVKKGGIILCDSTYVKPDPIEGVQCFEYPITGCAKETFGEVKTANIIALGIMTGLLDFVSQEAVEHAVMSRIPAKLKELNQRAFNLGCVQGRQLVTRILK